MWVNKGRKQFGSARRRSILGDCPSLITAGLTCGIKMTFTPTALGLRTAWLDIVDNASSSAQIFTLEGTGVRGPLKLSATILYLGHIAKGNTCPAHTVTLTNPNSVPLDITGIVTSAVNHKSASNELHQLYQIAYPPESYPTEILEGSKKE